MSFETDLHLSTFTEFDNEAYKLQNILRQNTSDNIVILEEQIKPLYTNILI